MTLGGARGNTAKEMKDVLHLTLADKELHAAAGEFLKGLSSGREGLELSIANALWGQAGNPFLDEFLVESKKHYDAGFNLVDFKKDTEKARKTINKWVENKTNDRIKELIKKGVLDKLTRMVLTNADLPVEEDFPEEVMSEDAVETVNEMETIDSTEAPPDSSADVPVEDDAGVEGPSPTNGCACRIAL